MTSESAMCRGSVLTAAPRGRGRRRAAGRGRSGADAAFSGKSKTRDHHLHRVVRRLLHGLHVAAVDEEVDAARAPVGGVDVGLGRRRGLAARRRTRRVRAGSRNGWTPMPTAAVGRAVLGQRVAEDLEDADLARALGLVLEADHPDRRHRARAELHARADLQHAVARRPAPLRRLGLAHDGARRGTAAGRRCCPRRRRTRRTGYPRRAAAARDRGAPQALPGRDRQPQLGSAISYVAALSARELHIGR